MEVVWLGKAPRGGAARIFLLVHCSQKCFQHGVGHNFRAGISCKTVSWPYRMLNLFFVSEKCFVKIKYWFICMCQRDCWKQAFWIWMVIHNTSLSPEIGRKACERKQLNNRVVSPPWPQSEKLVSCIPIPSIMVLGLPTPYIKSEVGESCDVWCLLTRRCWWCHPIWRYKKNLEYISRIRNPGRTILENNEWSKQFNPQANRKWTVYNIHMWGLSHQWPSGGAWGEGGLL
jgi:hypothetical protein